MIFSPAYEYFNLGLPLLFLAAALGEVFFGLQYSLTQIQNRILVDIFFLNVVHNVFTYGMLIGLPELRAWATEIGGGKLWHFWLRIFLINSGFAVFFYFFLRMNNSSSAPIAVFTALNVLVPLHHAISQTMGISLLYNRNNDNCELATPDLAAKLSRNEKRERRLFLALMAGVFALALHFTFTPQNRMIKTTLEIGTFLAAAGIVVNALLFPAKGKRWKAIFSMRALLWPIAYSSAIAGAATLAVHGLEYSFVSHKMVSRSRGLKFKGALLVILVAFLSLNCFREYFFYLRFDSRHVSTTLLIATSVSFALTFTHYYLDRQLFRMRNRETRAHCGPLLTEMKTSI